MTFLIVGGDAAFIDAPVKDTTYSASDPFFLVAPLRAKELVRRWAQVHSLIGCR
jgi:hypothetical protein